MALPAALTAGLASGEDIVGGDAVLAVGGDPDHVGRGRGDAGGHHGDEAPPGEDLSGFAPDFTKFDIVVSNYNGAPWPEDASTELGSRR